MPMSQDLPKAAQRANISKTAVWVAAARAIGAREPDPSVRNPDDLASALLGEPSQLHVVHPIVTALGASYDEAMQDLETVGLVRAMIIRTRFIDEALERAIAAGATQVLILGAGLDSHAYRSRELLSGARVFELDRPSTLEYKRRRVNEALGGAPENLTYVPLDLEEPIPATLARHGYDLSRRTFILMEGVSMYLPEAALQTTLQFIASHVLGSSLVFDFATRAMVEGIQRIDLASIPAAARASTERFLDIIRDEPWLFGISLDEEKSYLADLGLELGELVTIGGEESVARYLTRPDGTVVGGAAMTGAHAMRKAAIDKMMEQADPSQRAMIEERMKTQARQMAYRIAEARVTKPSSGGAVAGPGDPLDR
jgi:methyltransferase (TIGR00027 family)